MKAMIYKKYIDQRINIVLSSLLMVAMLYVDIKNFPIIFFWLTTSGISQSKEESAYFRTMNFSKNTYFKSTLIFFLIKFMLRSISLILAAIVFSKSFPTFIRFIFINYFVSIFEVTIELFTYKLSGKNKQRYVTEIMILVLFVLIFFIGLAFLIQQFYWPMERYVYGCLYLTLSSFLLGIYNYYNYKGVDYAKDKKLNI